jgi:hypothetical protein
MEYAPVGDTVLYCCFHFKKRKKDNEKKNKPLSIWDSLSCLPIILLSLWLRHQSWPQLTLQASASPPPLLTPPSPPPFNCQLLLKIIKTRELEK